MLDDRNFTAMVKNFDDPTGMVAHLVKRERGFFPANSFVCVYVRAASENSFATHDPTPVDLGTADWSATGLQVEAAGISGFLLRATGRFF